MLTINSIGSNIPIEVSLGGTNATSFATNTGIVKYDGTRLVTSSTAKVDASNRFVNASQPAFCAYRSSLQANVTGNGTAVSLVYDTELYDITNNYNNATGVFTAPVDGLYSFTASFLSVPANNATQVYIYINKVSEGGYVRPETFAHNASLETNYVIMHKEIQVAAGDGVRVQAIVAGTNKTSSFFGIANTTELFSAFYGHLIS